MALAESRIISIEQVSISPGPRRLGEKGSDPRKSKLLDQQERIRGFAANIENSSEFRDYAFGVLGTPTIYAPKIWEKRIEEALKINQLLLWHKGVPAESKERYRRVLEEVSRIENSIRESKKTHDLDFPVG